MLIFSGIYAEEAIDSKLIIPPQKPPMECIIDTFIDIQIDKQEVIDTPLLAPHCPPFEPPLPLRKVIITGIAKIKIKYSALVPDQRVHSAHFNVPFCTLIEWPGGPPQGTPIVVKPVIEKQVFRKEDERLIFKAILIRFDVYRSAPPGPICPSGPTCPTGIVCPTGPVCPTLPCPTICPTGCSL